MTESNVIIIYPTIASFKEKSRSSRRVINPKVSIEELESNLAKNNSSIYQWLSSLEPNFYKADIKGSLVSNKNHKSYGR